ncbi:cytosol aminopeptidase, putative [Eimeria mitis]|uniref:Cytosol aminopeptidase, putative n=1 Tax=Eimeria mitis TaxID=44415 RepID=U6KBK7_9EIME|nr:cytosol aminopeptidase, putative [Eimeria mitis]CDJ35385.1 cytosol aminopeptidase, putative [Eimeria mitis]
MAAATRERPRVHSVGVYIHPMAQQCPCPDAPKVFFRKIQALFETFFVEIQPDHRFKGTGSKVASEPQVEELTVFTFDVEETKRAIEAARHVASGVHLARELVNAPSNYCTTITLAKAAETVAKEGGLECRILDQPALEERGMGCYLAVAKGSMYPAQFIHLIYRPKSAAAAAAAAGAADGSGGAGAAAAATGKGSKDEGKTAAATAAAAEKETGEIKHKIAFVGKGLCFDSGGYNIKRAETSIEMMKFDMGGAAAVLGAARAVSLLQPAAVEIHFIAAAAENMVSSRAYRPGDVLRASNGKTIEVGNTDAEGRLTLADALVYAEQLHVHSIVDVATLTGACIVALGESYAGLFSPNDELAEEILQW